MAEQKKRNVKPKPVIVDTAQTAQPATVLQPTQTAEVQPTQLVQQPEQQPAQPNTDGGAAKKQRPTKQNSNESRYADLVIGRYTEKGWQVFKCDKGAQNDFVAHSGKNCHFVQVVTPETVESLRFAGEQRNTFIQNAFSNGATPVHAKVTIDAKKNGDPVVGVTFENANTKGRVTVVAIRKKLVEAK